MEIELKPYSELSPAKKFVFKTIGYGAIFLIVLTTIWAIVLGCTALVSFLAWENLFLSVLDWGGLRISIALALLGTFVSDYDKFFVGMARESGYDYRR